MNKPAPKEPSMDEILSSIRQIIADDDATVAPKKPSPAAISLSPAAQPRPVLPASPPPVPRAVEPEPLALTPEQMVRDESAEEASERALSFSDILGSEDESPTEELADDPPLVDPEDVTFEPDDDDSAVEAAMPTYSVPVQPEPVAPPPPPRTELPPVPRMPPPVAPSVARAAPMPDPKLSSDLAEQLLAPATDAAVKQNFAKLNGLSMVGTGVTLDALMRDMLRPMLKEWLDENLPSLVERMVEKEIARISRGGE